MRLFIESNVPGHVVYISQVVATSLAHPLDVLRANAQSNALNKISLTNISHMIYRQKGIMAFYYGFPGAISRCTVQTFSHYVVHRLLMNNRFILMLRPMDTYTVAAISGFVAGLVVTPFAKVTLMRQTELTRTPYSRRNYLNFVKGFKCMYSKGGARYMFAGYELHSLTTGAVSVLHSPIYDMVQRVLYGRGMHKKQWQFSLISLTLTGVILTLLFTPVDAIKTLIMNGDFDEIHSIRDTYKQILRANGYNGFFLGLKPAVYSILPQAIIATVTYHQIASYYNK